MRMMTTKMSKNQRRKMRKQLKGNGDYTLSDVMNRAKQVARDVTRDVLTNGGGLAGTALATRVGVNPALGRRLGTDLGAKLSRLIGTGDYTITNDNAVNALIKGSAASGDVNASFMGRTDGVRVRHREFIQDIVTGASAGTFNNIALPINAGLSSIMPYLANIAQNFEEYCFNGLVFEFVSSTSPYNSSSAMGTLVMAMEYNATAPAFTNKQQMENSDFAISARFDKSMMYGVECDKFPLNNYMVRYSAVSAGEQLNYDAGLLNIATAPSSTFPTNSVVGELWVSYDVTLKRPRISPARFGYLHVQFNQNESATGTFTPTSAGTIKAALGTLSSASVSATGVITVANAINGDVLSVQSIVSYAAAGISQALVDSSTGLATWNVINESNTYGIYPSTYQNSTTCGFTGFYTVSASTGGSITFRPKVTFQSQGPGDFVIDVIFIDIGNGLPSTY